MISSQHIHANALGQRCACLLQVGQAFRCPYVLLKDVKLWPPCSHDQRRSLAYLTLPRVPAAHGVALPGCTLHACNFSMWGERGVFGFACREVALNTAAECSQQGRGRPVPLLIKNSQQCWLCSCASCRAAAHLLACLLYKVVSAFPCAMGTSLLLWCQCFEGQPACLPVLQGPAHLLACLTVDGQVCLPLRNAPAASVPKSASATRASPPACLPHGRWSGLPSPAQSGPACFLGASAIRASPPACLPHDRWSGRPSHARSGPAPESCRGTPSWQHPPSCSYSTKWGACLSGMEAAGNPGSTAAEASCSLPVMPC